MCLWIINQSEIKNFKEDFSNNIIYSCVPELKNIELFLLEINEGNYIRLGTCE